MSDPFIGEIRQTGFNFAPRGWAPCDGQLLPIAQNTALFSLLGTQYGGDGRTTFALPDLNGRVAIGVGQGPGLSLRSQGEEVGNPSVALTSSEVPAHTHAMVASSAAASTGDPTSNVPAVGDEDFYAGTGPTVAMAPTGPSGGNQPHNNYQPTITVNFVIALEGVYPPRS